VYLVIQADVLPLLQKRLKEAAEAKKKDIDAWSASGNSRSAANSFASFFRYLALVQVGAVTTSVNNPRTFAVVS